MADFQLRVTAETQDAEKKLQSVDKLANAATKERTLSINLSEVNKSFGDFRKNVTEAGNNIRTFYTISKNIPGIGEKVQQFEELAKNTASTAKEQFLLGTALKENAKAGAILSNSFELATNASGRLVSNIAKIGFATFAVKEAVGLLQAAWNGFFDNTIGREIRLRETILKTQTTLASTNKIFRNGTEITDPYEKIVTLTGEVAKRIDSIRERSIALAGVTSNDVIEVFGIVAAQVGQIGGGLKEAEDLAINFAAALGTFGIPLYQAQQEIGSILRGQITEDSRLATALGIRSSDIAKAKTEIGGVTKFLEDRLAASVAGQKIAAQGFSGVISNIADLGELIGQNFGRGLLDPLLAALTAVFESLFRIRQQIFGIASGAGEAIGRAGQLIVGLTAGRTGLGAGDPSAAASAAASVAKRGFTELEAVAQRTVGALAQAIEALKPTALILVDAFRNIAEAFINIKVGTFEALASALANIASVVGTLTPSLAGLFNLYARFLNTPAVKYFSEVAAVLGLLKRVGLDAATQLVLFGRFILGAVVPAVGGLGTALAGLVGAIAAVILAVGKLLVVFAGLATALVGPAAAIPALATGLKALSVELLAVGTQATGAGGKLAALGAGFRGLGAGAKAAGASILASLGWVAAIQIGIAVVVDAFGRFQRAQEDQRSSARASEALRRLQTTYKDVGDSADSATKAARDFELAIVNAEYDKGINRIEELRKELNDLRYEAKEGIQTWNEFFRIVGAAGQVDPLGTGLNKEAARRLAEEAQIRKRLKDIDAQRDRERANEDIKLQAANRVNLEREIGELRRQIENDLFQQRQALAQKEVEIFQAAGQLRILQMEQANAKLIEGEEGASRAALEALNNYLSVRERGELEIEAAKKSLVIEVANLEREISNYRLENEKKIAEIRKRAGDYEQRVADYRRQAAGQTAAGTGGGAATFGSTGNVNNAAGWVHGHFQTNTGTLSDLVSDVIPVLKALLDQGIPVELSNGTRIAAGKDDAYYRRMLGNAASQHTHSGDGRSLDLFVPEGTKVPVPLSGITGNTGRGGITGGLPGSGKSWVGHLAPGSKAGGAAGLAPPTAPSFADVSAPAVEKYANAVRGVASAMDRLRALQAVLTGARTREAFDAIAKAAFQPVGLEQYQDELTQVQLNYEAVSAATADAFNPERARIAIEQAVKVKRSDQELLQIRTAITAQTNLSEKEKAQLVKQVTDQHKQYVQSLQQEELARQRIQTAQKASDTLQRLKEETAQTYREIELIKLRNGLEYEGASPERIAAAEEILRIRQELNRSQAELTENLQTELRLRDDILKKLPTATEKEKERLQKDLDAALKQIERLEKMLEGLPAEGKAREKAASDRAAASEKDPIQSLLGRWKSELEDTRAMVASLAQTIQSELASAMSNAVIGVIDGTTTVGEAFGQMFKNIGKAFVDMAMEMLTKMLMLYIMKNLLGGLFGGGATGGGGGGPTSPAFASPAVAAEGAYWSGGFKAFANGGMVNRPTLGLVGEGGEPEYIIPASKMRAAMGRYAGGARGAAVIPGNGESGGAGMGATPSGTIDVRYSIERINNVDYVTADQFQRGMAQAAQQGAIQGERRAMRTLKSSAATRRGVGI